MRGQWCIIVVCYSLFLHLAVASHAPDQCSQPPAGALWHQPPTADAAAAAAPAFPTGNKARAVNGRELQDLFFASEHDSSSQQQGLVVLFYLAGDPPSVAITPVFKCLPAFFSKEVQFVMVSFSELSLMTVVSSGLHALPVLQVNMHGRRYRYSGKHWLAPMLTFLAEALATEPAASLEVARFCSSDNKLLAAAGDAPFGTCRPRGLTDRHTSTGSSSSGTWGSQDVCDQHNMCSGPWQCSRWDGEVTLQELQAQPPRPHFYLSCVFLVLRLAWMACTWYRRRCTRRPARGAVAAAVAGAAGVAVPAAPAAAAPAAAPIGGTPAAAADAGVVTASGDTAAGTAAAGQPPDPARP